MKAEMTTRSSYPIKINQCSNHHPSCSSSSPHLTIKNYLCLYIRLRNSMNLKIRNKEKTEKEKVGENLQMYYKNIWNVVYIP